jgi:hypothetical protein
MIISGSESFALEHSSPTASFIDKYKKKTLCPELQYPAFHDVKQHSDVFNPYPSTAICAESFSKSRLCKTASPQSESEAAPITMWFVCPSTKEGVSDHEVKFRPGS